MYNVFRMGNFSVQITMLPGLNCWGPHNQLHDLKKHQAKPTLSFQDTGNVETPYITVRGEYRYRIPEPSLKKENQLMQTRSYY